MLYDIHVLQACDISYFAWKNAESRSRSIWPGVKMPSRPSPNYVFKVITSNVAHAMQAFRLLSMHGYDHQARNVLRNLLELFDVMIAILANEDFYMEYIKNFEDDDDTQKHWQSKLKPSIVRKMLEQLDVSDPINIPIDWTTVEIRRDMYGWLSKFTHNNFVSHLVATYPTDSDGWSQNVGMLGVVGGMSRATFAQALVYLWISSIRVHRLLWKKHKWGQFRGPRSRLWTGYRFSIINEISSTYLAKFWENEPEMK